MRTSELYKQVLRYITESIDDARWDIVAISYGKDIQMVFSYSYSYYFYFLSLVRSRICCSEWPQILLYYWNIDNLGSISGLGLTFGSK